MSAAKDLDKATASMPEEKKTRFFESVRRWIVRVRDQVFPAGTPVSIISPFGSVYLRAIMKWDGSIRYDGPVVSRGDCVYVIAWGVDCDGKLRVVLIWEERPVPDDPRQPGRDDHSPVVFASIPMGFCDGELVEMAAVRELREETGKEWSVLGVTRPNAPWVSPDPACYASWPNLVFVQLDLSDVSVYGDEGGEGGILWWQLSTVEEVTALVSCGQDQTGAYARDAGALAALFTFFVSKGLLQTQAR